MDPHEEVVNLFLDYETIGEHQWKESGIFDFFYHLPSAVFTNSNFTFATPEDLYKRLQPMAAISVPHAISWADEERDLTAWKGNDLQAEAFSKLYSLTDKIAKCDDAEIRRDWGYLQTSNHFYYMSTKWFSAGEIHKHFNPYGSPYDAFINYMNTISDFIIRVEANADSIKAGTGSIPGKPLNKTVKKSSAVKSKSVKKTEKAKAAKPETAQPKTARPKAAKPKTAKPKAAKPKTTNEAKTTPRSKKATVAKKASKSSAAKKS